MTRETKIGLLVGLAFIIVIGILLSDHLTNSNEPPQAALTGAGNGVRQAVGSPGTGGAAGPVAVVTPVVTPHQPVATQNELTPAPMPVIVKIGGPVAPVAPAPQVMQNDAAPKATDSSTAAVSEPGNTLTPVKPATPSNDELSRVAEQHGEPLVGLNDASRTAVASTEYVVQPGDSLSKIAAKYLGSSSKANVDLIVKANPSLKGDPNKIVAGRTYTIPSPAAAKAAAAAPAVAVHDADDAMTPTPAPAPTDAKITKPVSAIAAAEYLYTVQPGDNLTRIARDQVGDVHAVAAIQELNGDTLKGAKHDVVIAGTKLRLPGKPLAKAD